VIWEGEFLDSVHNVDFLPLSFVGGLIGIVGRVQWSKGLQNVPRFITYASSTRLLYSTKGLADIRPKETRTRLAGIINKLKREKHRRRKAMERLPMHVSRDGQRRIGEEVRSSLAYQRN
jgi:hypothetical protein